MKTLSMGSHKHFYSFALSDVMVINELGQSKALYEVEGRVSLSFVWGITETACIKGIGLLLMIMVYK